MLSVKRDCFSFLGLGLEPRSDSSGFILVIGILVVKKNSTDKRSSNMS